MLSRPVRTGTHTDMNTKHKSQNGHSTEVLWSDRLEVARSLGQALAKGNTKRQSIKLLWDLAEDPKWEVRREVARLLPHVPNDEFPQLAVRLSKDENKYVRRTAGQVLSRRRRTAEMATQACETGDEIMQRIDRLAERHGKRVGRQTLGICRRYNEIVVGSMIHDLRSILTYLTRSCEKLIAEGDRRRRTARRMRDDMKFLMQTIDDMATFTQPAPSARHLARVTTLAEAACELAQENARKCGCNVSRIRLTIDVPKTITVAVVEHLVVMALANVIKNALEACAACTDREMTEVQIAAKQEEQQVVITVSDNGIGMSDEEKHVCSLVVPGRRNKTKRRSTGYGLPISARHIAAHGGTLVLESLEDIGTTVTITLPLDHDETEHDYEGFGCRG